MRGESKELWEEGGGIKSRVRSHRGLPGEGIFEKVSKEMEVGFESTGKGEVKRVPVSRPRVRNNGLKRRACVQG